MNEQLPPCCIEAEIAVLGALLLDPLAVTRIQSWLSPMAFFVRSHQTIYDAILKLHYQGKQTDLISVSTNLQDRGLLEEIGGTAKLAQMLNQTVSAVVVEGHARLVMEKYQRRKLIAIAHGFLDIAQKQSEPLAETYDRIRQMLPEEITGASQAVSQPEITKVNYTVKSKSGQHQFELEANVTDDDNLADSIANVAAKAKSIGESLWGEEL